MVQACPCSSRPDAGVLGVLVDRSVTFCATFENLQETVAKGSIHEAVNDGVDTG